MAVFEWIQQGSEAKIGKFIRMFKCRTTNLVAYYIKDKNDILIKHIFEGDFKPLENNYGIYFLFGDEERHNGIPTIYIGQAATREESVGMDRLREHASPLTKDWYKNEWESALYITSTDNSWSTGLIDTLENSFIACFRDRKEYKWLNGKQGKNGNILDKDFKTELLAIIELLSLPMFGYNVSKNMKSDVINSVYDKLIDMAYDIKEELKEELKAEYLDKYEPKDRKCIEWVRQAEAYDKFKLSLELANNYIAFNRILNGTKGEVITPEKIAKQMVDMLPAEIFSSKTTFFDPACKSGIYLKCIIDRFMSDEEALPINHEDTFTDKHKRLKNLVENQLYGACLSSNGYLVSNRKVIETVEYYANEVTKHQFNRSILDSITVLPNIIFIDGYSAIAKDNTDELIKKLKDRFNIKEGDTLKFDVVIGNPPYNNDIYLDFVTLGHKLASKYTCMITPAKWQAKTDGKPKGSKSVDKNETFRQNIVPYMKDIVFYKDSTEIFSIEEWGGISYFLVDKNIHAEKMVKNICGRNIHLNDDWTVHDETTITLLPRHILQIIGKAGTLGGGFRQSLYVKNTDHGETSLDSTLGFKRQIFTGEQDRGDRKPSSTDYIEVMQGEKVSGYRQIKELFTTINLDKWKCICSIMPGAVSAFDSTGKVLGMFKISIIGPYQVPKGSFPVLKYFNTKQEAINFVSYMNTKFVSFLYYIGCCGTTLTREFFRYVPDPVIFNHIFTDNELYKKYNLTDEEIGIIESIIKERK